MLPFFMFGALGIFLGIAVPGLAFAQLPAVGISQGWDGPICAATGLCSSAPAGVAGINAYIASVMIPAIRTIFIGAGVLYVVWYAVERILAGGDESQLSETKKAFEAAAFGMATIGIASFLVDAFAPSATSSLVNASPFFVVVNRIADYITIIAGAFLVFLVSFAGFRIIVLQGNESEIETQKKNFFNGLIGMVLLLLARVIVDAVLPDGTGSASLVADIAGLIRFLLEIIAGLAVVALAGSGMLLVLSFGNDTLQQRARRTLLSTVIVLIVVVFSFTLVSLFLPASVPSSIP